MPAEQKAKTILRGNIKALIPLCREQYELQQAIFDKDVKSIYRRIGRKELSEKRIFGIVTAK